MSQQANVQITAAYAWSLILAVAGAALIIGALGRSPGEDPATILAEEDNGSPAVIANTGGEPDIRGDRAGISHVSNTE